MGFRLTWLNLLRGMSLPGTGHNSVFVRLIRPGPPVGGNRRDLIFFKMELYSCFRKSTMGALESLNLLKGMDP